MDEASGIRGQGAARWQRICSSHRSTAGLKCCACCLRSAERGRLDVELGGQGREASEKEQLTCPRVIFLHFVICACRNQVTGWIWLSSGGFLYEVAHAYFSKDTYGRGGEALTAVGTLMSGKCRSLWPSCCDSHAEQLLFMTACSPEHTCRTASCKHVYSH